MIKNWNQCNCSQCWSCKNCTEKYTVSKTIAVINSPLANDFQNGPYDDEQVYLPYCKVMDMMMTYVNNMPCDKYEKEN